MANTKTPRTEITALLEKTFITDKQVIDGKYMTTEKFIETAIEQAIATALSKEGFRNNKDSRTDIAKTAMATFADVTASATKTKGQIKSLAKAIEQAFIDGLVGGMLEHTVKKIVKVGDVKTEMDVHQMRVEGLGTFSINVIPDDKREIAISPNFNSNSDKTVGIKQNKIKFKASKKPLEKVADLRRA